MKKIILILTIFLSFFISVSISYSQSLAIDSMDIEMNVYENNSIEIIERITAKFYDSDMHGIFRDLPKKSYFGKPIKYENISVNGAPFKIESIGDYMRIRIGDPNQFARDTEVYEINYLLIIGDDRNPELDELYFNIIGSSWEIPISNITFDITMPKAFDESKINITGGNVGSTSNEGINYDVNGLSIKGNMNETIYPGQALTIALPLPEGYFDVEEEIYLYEKIKTLYPYLFIILLILGVIIKWKYGTNNQLFPTVEFYSPDKLTPAEIGYIYDEQVDPYDLTSMLIYWASNGYIRIIEKEETKGLIFKKDVSHMYLEKIKNLPDNVLTFEKVYFNDLFDDYAVDGIVDIELLTDSFYKTITVVRSFLIESFKKNSRKIYSFKSRIWSYVLLFISLIMFFMFFSNGLVSIMPFETLVITGLSFGASVAMLAIFGLSAKLFSLVKTRLPKDRFKILLLSIILGVVGLVLLGIFWLFVGVHLLYSIFVLTSLIFIYISPYALKRTDYGDKMLSKIIGFKAFIENAEKDRINRLVNEDPEYFYKILPYAMVLGVTDEWAKQFENIALDQPSWYDNRTGRNFSTIYFVNHLNKSTESISRNMTSTPSQSTSGGSSGGGFSGGGSGGGGGGGW